jgi:hypothetical protein
MGNRIVTDFQILLRSDIGFLIMVKAVTEGFAVSCVILFKGDLPGCHSRTRI